MKTTKYFLLLIITSVLLASCVNDLNVTPKATSTIMTFDQDAVFAKIYATLGTTGQKGPDGDGDVDGIDEGTSAFYRMMWELNEFGTDEGWWVWSDVGVPQVRALTWNSSNTLVAGLYYRLYFDITLCNHFLENTSDGVDSKTDYQRAETRFLRALNYYYLLDMYGSVPFATNVSTEKPKQISRTDLYNWILSELKDIEPKMFADGTKTGYYRADQVADWLLQARIYLNAQVYTGTAQWDSAAVYSAKVMQSSYKLAPIYKQLFMGDNDNLSTVNTASQEIILPIAQDGIQTECWGGARFMVSAFRTSSMNPCGTDDYWACFRSSPTLVEKFFPDLTLAATIKGDENSLPSLAGDDRCLLCDSIDSTGFSTGLSGDQSSDFDACWSICKFTGIYASGEQGSDNSWPDTDLPLMRAAEAYLTYAEAVFRGGTAVDGTALAAVNALRKRAHATEWGESDLTLDNLLDEWSREFYCEGRRRSDLIRFGKFGGDNANYNWEGKGGTDKGENVDAKYNLYPIPYADLTANPNLTQTSGY